MVDNRTGNVTFAVRSSIVPDHERRNAHLHALLLRMARTVPDTVSYARGKPSYFVNKWRSDNDLFRLPDPEIAALVGFIEHYVNQAAERRAAGRLTITSMWAIVGHAGMWGRVHAHSGTVSGVYYVDAGDGGAGGEFAIHTRLGGPPHLIRPRTGQLIIFPSALLHGVMRYDGDRPRIAVSFDMTRATD